MRKLKKLIDSLSQKPRKFWLCGGEPSLRKDLAEIVAHIKKRGHRCMLTTNALLLNRKLAGQLLSAGIDEISVSLHGTPEIHDKITGSRGTAARVKKFLRFAGASPLNKHTTLTIWCTINRLNHSRLYEVYRYLKTFNPCCISFNHMDYITEAGLKKTRNIFRRELRAETGLKASENLAAGISPGALARETNKIKAACDPAVRFKLDLNPAEIRRWYSPRSDFKKRGFCLAQWNSLWIDPCGEVVSCQPMGYRMGSVRSRQALDIFNGQDFRKFRAALLKSGGYLPTCSRCGRTSYISVPSRKSTA